MKVAFRKLFKDHEDLDEFISKKSNTGTSIRELRKWVRIGEIGCNSQPTRWLRRFVDAIRAEVEELSESIPWKWWRGEKMDVQNVRIELVDIFHFVMSAAAAAGMTGEEFIELYYKKRKLNYDRQVVGFKKHDNKDLHV